MPTTLACTDAVQLARRGVRAESFLPFRGSALRILRVTRQSTETSELTPQEKRVLRLVERGLLNKHIASELGISVPTVKKHLEHILAKLGVTTRTAAAAVVHGSRLGA